MTQQEKQKLLSDLARAKAVFQTRAILAAMEIQPDSVKPSQPKD